MAELWSVVGWCYTCGCGIAACPECVNTIRIDPETGLPPDVAADRTRQAPNPAAVERAVQVMICDRCVELANRRGANPKLVTWRERHATAHAGVANV